MDLAALCPAVHLHSTDQHQMALGSRSCGHPAGFTILQPVRCQPLLASPALQTAGMPLWLPCCSGSCLLSASLQVSVVAVTMLCLQSSPGGCLSRPHSFIHSSGGLRAVFPMTVTEPLLTQFLARKRVLTPRQPRADCQCTGNKGRSLRWAASR